MADYKICGSIFDGSYSGTGLYTYETIDIGTEITSNINFVWGTDNRPNRFSVYDIDGLVWTSGWVGVANYGGPWGESLNTPISGSQEICFELTFGRYVIVEAGPADLLNPLTDFFEFTITCNGECIDPVPGDNCCQTAYFTPL
jgi:hypothetical protein